MRKISVILFAGIFFCIATQAQEKKYVYTDSSLTETEDGASTYDSVMVSAPVEEAAPSAVKDQQVYTDTSLYYSSLPVSKDSIEAWKNMKSFAYVKYLDSLLKAKKAEEDKYVRQQAENISNTPSRKSWLDRLFVSNGLQVFLWILAGVFVLFILYKLFLTEGVFRRGNNRSKTITPDAEEEVIDRESDFDALLRNAVQSGNYRLAVRYHYLQTLHLLAGKNQIQLATDKTNYQYVQEISNRNYQNDFAALTLNYEYVWYGEFAIESLVYAKIKTAFTAFNNQL